MIMKYIFPILIFLGSLTQTYAADSCHIRVLFIYGSRPSPDCDSSGGKWFGGIHGGHVGVQLDSSRVIDFAPSNGFHYIGHKKNCLSAFSIRDPESFWETFRGSDSASVKRLSIRIPVSSGQYHRLDSLSRVYTCEVPYDYAFLGMRCAAASYDLLQVIGVTRERGRLAIWSRFFYPKLLRKYLMKKAKKRGWKMESGEGSPCRVWESD